MENVFNHVQKTQKKTKSGRKESKRIVKKNNKEPTDLLDPENEDTELTLIKICDLLEYLRTEIKNIKETIESKVELSTMNTLSIKMDNLENAVTNISNDVDDLK
jgi:hypothetical protein